MKFSELHLPGAFVIDIEPRADDRGFFSRTWCAREFAEHGLFTQVAQQNVSYNRSRGTVRGLHMQLPPASEAKLIRCTRGAVVDVIVDMRPDSPTYLEHFAAELSAENRRALYVPEGFAHGYQTLLDDTEVEYQVSEFYSPEHERGFRYDDPQLGIKWPMPVSRISEKDASWPLLDVAAVR